MIIPPTPLVGWRKNSFAGEEQTLRHCNWNRHQVEKFTKKAMMREILDTITDAEGAAFDEPSAPAPDEIFCTISLWIGGGTSP